jgi:ABC-type lipoprotein export system ATPase subunit
MDDLQGGAGSWASGVVEGPSGCGKTTFVEAQQDTTLVTHPLADH